MSSVEQVVLEVRSGIGIVGEAPAQHTVDKMTEVGAELYGIHTALGSIAGVVDGSLDKIGKELTASTVTHRRAFDGSSSLHQTLESTGHPDAVQTLAFADVMLAEANDQLSAAGELVVKVSQLRRILALTEPLMHEVLAFQADMATHATAVLGAQQGTIQHGEQYIASFGQSGAAE